MSQENVDIVRRSYDALNVRPRDYSLIPEFLDPEAEIDVSRNLFNPTVDRGHDGFERIVRATDDVWDEFHTAPLELIDAGDRVLAAVRISGKGAGSGVVTEMDLFNVFTLRDGMIVKIVGGIRNRSEALELAGLTE